MKDKKLENLCQQVLDRAEELGADHAAVCWWFGDNQQERSFFRAPDTDTAELEPTYKVHLEE